MKTKMRPRYYCDHCNRGSGSPSAMRRHEETCTANPKRYCHMCRQARDVAPLAAILTAAGGTLKDWQGKMERLRDAAENCPCCILASIRQSGVQREAWTPDEGNCYPDTEMEWSVPGSGTHMLGFNFKREKAAYLESRPRPERDSEYGY